MSNTRTRRKALLRKKRRKRIIKKTCILGIACLIIMLFIFTINNLAKQNVKVKEPPEFEVDLLTVNEYSRPGFAMNKINGIVIHYTANTRKNLTKIAKNLQKIQNFSSESPHFYPEHMEIPVKV